MANPYWPLFDLRITTPRLSMRVGRDEDLFELVSLIGEGIHSDIEMPFKVPWTRGESPERERKALQYYWETRSWFGPEKWAVPFVIEHEGEIVGAQDLFAEQFSISKVVDTGSWLVERVQGRGLGKEMRAAALYFAFENLGAECATTEALDWNHRSQGVTLALGYESNGESVLVQDGKRAILKRYLLTRQRWKTHTRDYVPVEIVGTDALLPLLGVVST